LERKKKEFILKYLEASNQILSYFIVSWLGGAKKLDEFKEITWICEGHWDRDWLIVFSIKQIQSWFVKNAEIFKCFWKSRAANAKHINDYSRPGYMLINRGKLDDICKNWWKKRYFSSIQSISWDQWWPLEAKRVRLGLKRDLGFERKIEIISFFSHVK